MGYAVLALTRETPKTRRRRVSEEERCRGCGRVVEHSMECPRCGETICEECVDSCFFCAEYEEAMRE